MRPASTGTGFFGIPATTMRPPRGVISSAASSAGAAPEQSTMTSAPPPASPRTAWRRRGSPSGSWAVEALGRGPGPPPGWRSNTSGSSRAPARPAPCRADRAVADDHEAFAAPRAAALERVQPDGQRLEQRPDLVAHPAGQRHRAVGGEADQRREGAVGGEADRAAEHAVVVLAPRRRPRTRRSASRRRRRRGRPAPDRSRPRRPRSSPPRTRARA